jgi:signal transduction histidine kinase
MRISELLGADDQRALLEGLFQHAPIAFQIYNADGHCLLVNDAFRELFDSEPPPEYSILEDDVARQQGMLELVHRAFAGETVRLPPFWYDPREMRHIEVNEGRAAAIELVLVPLLDTSGSTRLVALCFKDVTSEFKLRQERARISRDLHDGIATELTALVWKTRELAARPPDVDRLRAELESFGDRLRSALSDLRDVVVSLRRSTLGIRAAIELLERRCRELSGAIPFSLEVRGEPVSSDPKLELDEVWDDALPICFELVRNAAFHSGCQRIRVELELGRQLVLSVFDDGRGLDADVFERSAGGIGGVRQRVSELGGTVERSSVSHGTNIVVALPR